MHTALAKHTLTELTTAQQNGFIMAFDMGSPQRHIARLQAKYTADCAQLEALYRIFEGVTPDIKICGLNGQEVVFRLPADDTNNVLAAIRDSFESTLRELESEIVAAHLLNEQEDGYAMREPDLRPAILALCTPAATSSATPVTETPAPDSLPALPAGQRLFVTPPTRPNAASAV